MFFMLSVLILTACGSPQAEKENVREQLRKEAEKENVREQLRKEAETANKNLKGVQIDYATTSNGCEFKNDTFYYYYTVNEQYVDFDAMRAQENAIKANIKRTLDSSEETIALLELIKKVNGKIIYEYTGSDSNQIFTITLDY